MDLPRSTDYTVVHSQDVVRCREDSRDVVHCKENVWSDQVNIQHREFGSKMCQYSTDSPTILEYQALTSELETCVDKKNRNDSSPSTISTQNAFDKEIVKSHGSFANPIISDNRVTFPDHLLYSYVQPEKISHKCKETAPETLETFERSKFEKEAIVSGNKEKCSKCRELAQIILNKDSQHVCQQQKHILDKCEQPIDQECSVSNICDDDTFFSIKSGSYSRSSSVFSSADHTDTESCLFEEALEDLPGTYSYNQEHYSHGHVYTFSDTDQQPVACPNVEARNLSKAGSLRVSNNAEVTVKQHRNISCNTDLSWPIGCRSDKETQTKEMDSIEMGVNTCMDFSGFSTQDAVNLGSGFCESTGNCKGNKCFSPASHEALMERVVNAELKLLDVQRWMCWQLCWKTQQQYMEKQSLVNMHTAFAEHSQDVVGFNLLSALIEVEEKYLEIKTQIKSGVPLDALIPLSMQLTKVNTPPNNILNQCFMEACPLQVQKWSADHSEELQKKKGNNHPSTSVPCTTEDLQNKGVHQAEQFLPEQKRYYVHVGNIASSVKEVDLRIAFGKFDVSNIFLEESSLTTSYAVLIFACPEKAQSAVKEMDGKMFFGRKIKVRIVRNAMQNFQFSSQEVKVFSATSPKEKTKLGPDEPQDKTKLAINKSQEKAKLGTDEPQEKKLGNSKTQEKAKLGTDEPQEKIKFGINKTQEKRKLVTDKRQTFTFQPQPNVSTFSKPVQVGVKKGSNWENWNVFPNMQYSRPSFPRPSQTFQPAPISSTSAIFDCMRLSSQWAWHTVCSSRVPYNSIPDPVYAVELYPSYTLPGVYPFSFQTPVNIPMCKPGVNLNSNAQFIFNKDAGLGVQPPPTGRCPVHNSTTSLSSSTRMFNRDTSVVTTLDRDSVDRPVKSPVLVTTQSSEKKDAKAGLASTAATQGVSSSLSITATADCEIPASCDNVLSNQNKTIANSGKLSFKSAAPLRLPNFVPESVIVPETTKTGCSTIATDTKDVLTAPSNTDLQQSGYSPLDETR